MQRAFRGSFYERGKIIGWHTRNHTIRGERNEASQRRAKSFFVPGDEIRANKYDLSLSSYKEIEHKEIEYDKPEAIMERVLELEREIAKEVGEIKSMI